VKGSQLRSTLRNLAAGVVGVTLALTASGCVQSERDDADGDSSGGTFVYATTGDPVSLDPAFIQDMTSGLVGGQIFEGLTGVKAGTAEAEPRLATDWEVSDDSSSYDFTLREGVTFQDGTAFDAEAVCFNFDRWYNLPKTAQSANFAYYYSYFFHGFATGETKDFAIYDSCTATSDHKVSITLEQPFPGLIDALTMPQFAMQSPIALEKYQDDSAANPNTTDYATAHPVGTGPFSFASWDRGKQVVLERNDDYWGETAKIDRLVFLNTPDTKARVAALRNGEVNGADSISPTDLESLESEGYGIAERAPFTLAFLGFNQKRKPLDDKRVREAIAHAIDRSALIAATYPDGTTEANQFLPEGMQGWNEGVTTYDYDPERAKQLIEEAGVVGETIELNYQSGGGNACMPAPEDTLNVLRTQIEAIGLKAEPVAIPRSEYGNRIYGTADHGLEMSCWIGQVNLADSFLGLAFGFPSGEFGLDDPDLYQDLAEAQKVSSAEEQEQVYAELSDRIMRDILPGVPFASSPSFVGLDDTVSGFEASPIGQEMFNTVTLD
jgi:peptide/nickel transport system substrate-binding protein